jgi:hypothetical protein
MVLATDWIFLRSVVGWLNRYGLPIALLVIYAVGIWLFAAYIIGPRLENSPYRDHNRVAWTASRRMPAGTLLRAAELVRPSDLPLGYYLCLPKVDQLQGRYLTETVAANQPVRPAMTRALPVIVGKPGRRNVVVSLAKQPGWDELLNTGAVVDLRVGGERKAKCAEVQSLVWAIGGAAASFVVVSVSEAEGDALKGADEIEVVLVTMP